MAAPVIAPPEAPPEDPTAARQGGSVGVAGVQIAHYCQPHTTHLAELRCHRGPVLA